MAEPIAERSIPPGWSRLSPFVALLAGALQAVSIAWPFPAMPTWAGAAHGGLQVLAMALLVAVLQEAPTFRAAALRAWLFGLAWLTGTFWWLFISMHVYGGLAAPLAVAAVLALAGFLALYCGMAGALFWRCRVASPWAAALAFAGLWTLAELARGTWFTGFPWGAGGYAQVDALGWLAPYVGVYGLGAVSAGLGAWAVLSWRSHRPGGARPSGWMLAWRGWPLWLALPLLVWPGAGLWLNERLPLHTRSSGDLPVTLLQGNIPQDEKFAPASGVALALSWYGEQFQAALAESRRTGIPGLVVAPETAIPLLPQDMEPQWWEDLRTAVVASPSAVMLGLPLGNWDEGFTNSVVAWTPDGALYRYDKHHLVPFGEFIPPFFRWFTNLMNIPLGDFNRGALGQAPLHWAGQRVAPNVCYEDLFGEELAVAFRDEAAAPTVLVNVSNIAWFGDSVAIDQHRHISRMRALEFQRPMLRATNTGATAVIDHLGRVTHEWPRLQRGVLQAQAQGREGLTPYARWVGAWGLWPLIWLCLAAWAVALRSAHLKSRVCPPA